MFVGHHSSPSLFKIWGFIQSINMRVNIVVWWARLRRSASDSGAGARAVSAANFAALAHWSTFHLQYGSITAHAQPLRARPFTSPLQIIVRQMYSVVWGRWPRVGAAAVSRQHESLLRTTLDTPTSAQTQTSSLCPSAINYTSLVAYLLP